LKRIHLLNPDINPLFYLYSGWKSKRLSPWIRNRWQSPRRSFN
jgi:hypothetical protein